MVKRDELNTLTLWSCSERGQVGQSALMYPHSATVQTQLVPYAVLALFHGELGSSDLHGFGVVTGLLLERAGHSHRSPGTNEIVSVNGQFYELIQGPVFVAAGHLVLHVSV